MTSGALCGVLCVDKPQELTSFDIVAIARKAAQEKRIGHGGTLDPMATGVLPLFIGRAAKLIDLIPDSGKQYRAGFRLGAESDTEDVWGTVTETNDRGVTQSELESAAAGFIGEISQTPPMYSAVKVNGRRLYDIARGGEVIDRPARKVTVRGIKLLSYEENTRTGELLIDCSKGTYIRTLISDIGRKLGVGGIMTSLVRTRSAGFELSDCITLEQLREQTPCSLKEILLPSERLFDGCREELLDGREKRLFLNGTVPYSLGERLNADELVRIKDGDGRFLGLVKTDAQNQASQVYLEITA